VGAEASADARTAADFLRQHSGAPPRLAIVLGTGLGGLAEHITGSSVVSYADIPHFPHATVAGHAGRMVLGELQGVPVAAMQGRFHLYEGYAPQQVVLPIRTLRLLGAETLIVTNAAGGLNPAFGAGELMVLSDHIGLATMAGLNPLRGPNDDALGPRFPSLTNAYDANLRAQAHAAARALAIPLHEGVYAMVGGPNYETPAELRFLRAIGADAVGMSTVPEVIAARHSGMRVLAISCITNVTLPADANEPPPEPSHAEVVANAERAGIQLTALVERVVAEMA
ncbi:MAG TPA: purine-nucleoside phosphorylase, partial [Ktedonobacterales bacterium]|nr:purine-nucleoside phosphorylase [Ktedonobacterales bacterium]